MPIHEKPDWPLAERAATDEDVSLSRRRILTAFGIGGVETDDLAAPPRFSRSGRRR
jgi:hypothetical protein